MPICAECGKRVGFFDSQLSISSQNYFCSDECRSKFREKKNIEKEMQKKGMTKEIRCKCNQCGKIWHYSESREEEIKKNISSNVDFAPAAFLIYGAGVAAQTNRNADAQKDLLDKLKKCPECSSSDMTKKDIYYEKK